MSTECRYCKQENKTRDHDIICTSCVKAREAQCSYCCSRVPYYCCIVCRYECMCGDCETFWGKRKNRSFIHRKFTEYIGHINETDEKTVYKQLICRECAEIEMDKEITRLDKQVKALAQLVD